VTGDGPITDKPSYRSTFSSAERFEAEYAGEHRRFMSFASTIRPLFAGANRGVIPQDVTSSYPGQTDSDEKGAFHKERACVENAYDEIRSPLYNNLIFLGMTADQADDVIQEAFLTLFRHLRAGHKVNEVRAWVFRVAHNLSMNVQKQVRRTILRSSDAETQFSSLASSAMNPEQEILSREQAQHLESAIGHLTSQQRECLLLRKEGLRYREIATVLGVSQSRVPQLLDSAVSRIAKELYG
jgi:RNA polymerase sigma-70 factor, ECF subfamily